MALTTLAVTNNSFRVDLVKMKVVKGNELTDLITETFDGRDFAPSLYPDPSAAPADTGFAATVAAREHGMSRGRDRNLSVYISKQIALLGARGDYLEVIVEGAELGTQTAAMQVRMLLLQAIDFTGVPVAVQHAIFGKYSPFLTPTQPVSPGMIRGIDRQEIEFVNNVVLAADDTYVEQEIRGVASERLQYKADVYLTPTKFTLKAKPLSDGVFVIPRGALIWAGEGLACERIYTYG